MSQLSKLQAKIGGPAAQLDKAALLMAAQRSLESVTPTIEAALHEQRRALQATLFSPELSLQELFSAAHQIRGMAGSISRPTLGALADVLATYITECADAGVVCADVPLRALASALERSFDQSEGDAILSETLAAAKKLTLLFGASRRAGNGDLARS
ncbi:MAG: Hpt domain-containing protein [Caulobacteraceae bacterium]|jgi:HPt (histidine-containing phosphotransfer) domain-containing protein|nr:Hpt domain-containing protein [Caulobacteraceae bacterium]